MPKRLQSPFQFGQAVLEPIVQPVYDSVELTAATPNGAFSFFTDTAGKTNREIFPGITGGGQLSAPRMMVIYSVRFHVDENIAAATQVADLKNILYNGVGVLTVGIKDYAVAPLFWYQSGLGISGFVGGGGGGTIAADGSATNGVPAHNSYWSISDRRIAVPPQQAFRFVVTIAGAAVLAVDTELWVFFDTEFGFEVQ
jgi:hypothetical protein